MKSTCYQAAVCAVMLCALGAQAAGEQRTERSLQGTWCLDQQELMLTFYGKDSVRVTSTSDQGVNGVGRYARHDTMFVATVTGDSLQIVMGYRYEWKSDSTIEARTLFVTVNGDSVRVSPDPIPMHRCGAGTHSVKSQPATEQPPSSKQRSKKKSK